MREWLVLATSYLALSCSHSQVHGDLGAGGRSVSSEAGLGGSSAGSHSEVEASSNSNCSLDGWRQIDALSPSCQGICQPDDTATRVPALTWQAKNDWCAGCLVLDTPWATTDAQRQQAVDGSVRAWGAGPDFFKIGMFPSAMSALIGLYGADSKPLAGFYAFGEQPCGRVSSLRFSHTGKVGAHLLQDVGLDQFFFQATAGNAQALFATQNRAFDWPKSIVGASAINDMWFSDTRQVIDLSGEMWVADLTAQTATQVSKLPSALPGEYGYPEIVGSDVFVSRWVQGQTDYWVYNPQGLVKFLGSAELDIKALVSDGQTMVWLQGSGPTKSDAGVQAFSHYALYRSPYTTDPTKLAPQLLADGVPSSLFYLVMANGYVVGSYLISQPIYRSGAFVVRLSDGKRLRSILPNNYSWGYELYPSASELWGAVTPGPMIQFETIARIPLTSLESVP